MANGHGRLMKGDLTCPRCGGALRPPGLWSSTWQCDLHGEVAPLHPVNRPSAEALAATVGGAKAPVWLPWPLPHGWLLTGLVHAGDERTGWVAVGVACSGPAPLGGAGDLVLVAEEPGVGLGARYAALPNSDPGVSFEHVLPDAKVHAAGHPTPMWHVAADEQRAVYVGEAVGMWLWAVLWPADAGVLLMDDLVLTDLRNAGHELDVPCGALTPRLAGPATEEG